MPAIKPRTARAKPRIEDTEPKSSTRKDATHRSATAPIVYPLADGQFEITCQASELVPVAQYASVTVGPIAVKRVVTLDSIDGLKDAIQEVNVVLWDVIAEDRELIEESVRLHNNKEAEAEAKASKRSK